ncbi:MAG: class I SAM-dependent methyltransferase, partial [Planctomycetes bacterium]|nr:class I SAM-dependent methyltransferase [Planctomycetota bacterium]
LAIFGTVDSILDCPGGTGRFWPLLTRHGRSLHAADASAEMLRAGREAHPDLILASCTVAMAQDLPFEDGHFDLVFSSRLLHHFDTSADRIAILRSFARVCRKGIVVSMWQDGNRAARRDARRAVRKPDRPRHRFFQSRARILEDLDAAGLRCLRWQKKSPMGSPVVFIAAAPRSRSS